MRILQALAALTLAMSSSATTMSAHAQGLAAAAAAAAPSAGCSGSPSACFRAHHAQLARVTADALSPASTSASLQVPQWAPQMRTTTSGFLGTEWGNGVDIGILVGALVALLLLCCSLYCCCSPTRKKKKGADQTTTVIAQPSAVPMMATPMQQQAAAAAADPYAAQRRVQEQEAATLAADRRRFEMEREVMQMEQAAAANRAAAAAVAAPAIPARPAAGSFDDTPDHPVTVAYSTVPPPMNDEQLPAINPYVIPPSSNSLAESFAQHQQYEQQQFGGGSGAHAAASGAPRTMAHHAVPASALSAPYTGVPRAHASRGFAYEEEMNGGDWDEEEQPDDIPVIGRGQFATLTRA